MKLRFMLFMLLLLLPVAGAVAQETSNDETLFYVTIDSVLYRWDGETLSTIADLAGERQAITVMSPDQQYAAYTVGTSAFDEEIEAEGPAGGLVIPADIYLIDTTTGETIQIAGQPEGATLAEGIRRSAPVWSPDGTRLAWVEGTEDATLVIYDLAAGSAQPVAEGIPAQTLTPSSIRLSGWVESGIWLQVVDFSANMELPAVSYRFYAPDGTLINESDATDGEPDTALVVRDGNQEKLLRETLDGWTLFDIQTGDIEPLTNGMIYAYAAAAPETSLRFGAMRLTDEGQTLRNVRDPQGTTQDLTLPRSRLWFLYNGGRVVEADRSGTRLTLWSPERGYFDTVLPQGPGRPLTDALAYELLREGTGVQVGVLCDGGALPLRMVILDEGWTTTATDLYDAPDASAGIIATLEAGDWFTVSSAPTLCQDGVAWWQVDFRGVTGWLAEGSGTTYTLVPGCPEGGCGQG